MEQVQRASLRLADRTAAVVSALWASHLEGRLTVAEFRRRASLVVANANATAAPLADLGITAELIRQTGKASRPLGLRATPLQTDTERIGQAIERVIGADIASADTPEAVAESRRARLARFGRDEALLTVATTSHEALLARRPSGWVRRTDPDPCPVCVGLADGKVRSVEVEMRRHRGCACMAQPVF